MGVREELAYHDYIMVVGKGPRALQMLSPKRFQA